MMKASRYLALLLISAVHAELTVSPLFSNHAILQRDKALAIWGTADPDSKVTVRIGSQEAVASSSQDGKWRTSLEPMAANAEPQTLRITSGQERIELKDILIGEVWVLGGQSNMEHQVTRVTDGDLELPSARYPKLRLFTMPRGEASEPSSEIKPLNQYNDFEKSHEQKGSWAHCTPESAREFSAIGYAFGRRIHMAANIPVGLIDASRGGTAVEAWVSRATLEQMPELQEVLAYWDKQVAEWDPQAALAERIKRWEERNRAKLEQGQSIPPKPTAVESPAANMNRPANCYNFMLHPLSGLAIRGVIFNQGFTNAATGSKPSLYLSMMTGMIRDWQVVFGDRKLPFGIIELTGCGDDPQTLENYELAMIDGGPYVREAQQKAAKQIEGAVCLPSWDQQMDWYHPRDKFPLGERAARWALAEIMQLKLAIPWKPAQVVSIEFGTRPDPGEVVVTFDQAVRSHDGRPFRSFAVAGEDRHFHPAQAVTFEGEKQKFSKAIIVSSPLVAAPVALRFAWARNPWANLCNHSLRPMPVPQFRSDDWPYPEAGFGDQSTHRRLLNAAKKEAQAMAEKRLEQEARQRMEER